MRLPAHGIQQRLIKACGLLFFLCSLQFASQAQAQCSSAVPIHPPYGGHENCAREQVPTHVSAVAPALPQHSQASQHSPVGGRAEDFVRWEGARASSSKAAATAAWRDTSEESPVSRKLDSVPWADSHDWVHNPPQVLRELRNYRRQGLPIVHLVNSAQTVVAIGVNRDGKPGLFFTRKLPF